MKDPLEYDRWYDEYPFVLESELDAIRFAAREMLNDRGLFTVKGLEVGGGTGRFALALGIRTILEPSESMGSLAKNRGLEVINGFAEKMPFENSSFDVILFVTSLCFVSDSEAAIKETSRVLKISGKIIIGMINPDSPSGRNYIENAGETIRSAQTQSPEYVIDLLEKHGFSDIKTCQTIFEDPLKLNQKDVYREGYDAGVFVVISGEKIK
jgi:ubiquinone/menaquinone biosynthesis C-methylase UbiE